MKREIPKLPTDEAAEAFLEQDLSDLDYAQFKPGQLEFERKDARLTMRVPQPMLDAVKRRARARGIPYQRFVREAIQQALTED
jgi:predicted DNA binding CopG/RHH family protein